MKRVKKFSDGAFAINLSKFHDVWIPFSKDTLFDDALIVARKRAEQLEDDALEVCIENPKLANQQGILAAVDRLRDARQRAAHSEFRQTMKELR